MRAPLLVPWLVIASSFAGAGGEGPGEATRAAGERLLAAKACAACHAAGPTLAERLAPRPGPDLGAVGARYEARALRRFLLRPHATQPGIDMPDLLGGLPEAERERAADELVHFLVSRGGPLDLAPRAVRADELEHGRQLYHSVGCVACHAPQESAEALRDPLWVPPAPHAEPELDPGLDPGPPPLPPGALPPGEVPLGDLATRTTVDALTAFLVDPLWVRPAGRMPSLGLSEGEARAIASYLLRHQATDGLDFSRPRPGLAYEYFEAPMTAPAPDFTGLRPVRRGTTSRLDRLPEHRADHFGFLLHGLLEVPARGTWRFSTTSDDGSRLWVEGRLVVRNDGFHPMARESGELWLEEGPYAIAIEYFEHEGQEGLVVEWEGPGVARGVIPPGALSHVPLELAPPRARAFAVDTERARAGRERFAALACGACHAVGEEPRYAAPRRAPELAELDPSGSAGCLAPAPAAGLPRYALDDSQRAALAAALADLAALEAPLSPAERIARTLERHACLACHGRDGLGGVHPARRDYFRAADEAHDLGDQARFPPALDQVGRKLRGERLRAVLEEGASARPYLAVRMPRFGAANVAHLVEDLAHVDLRPGDDLEPEVDAERIAIGRRLAGTAGLGCIQCHAFAGYAGLGTPAVDLADAFEHTRPGWFADLLRDPAALGQTSRMPDFWVAGQSPVRDVYEGDPERQIEALRAYLSLGRGAPLPEGLAVPPDAYELVVGSEPVLCGVFMEGVSPRTMVVGTPEGLHYAFDMQNSRLAKLWRGRFFDARGTWHGRAGALERPPVADALDLPAGMPLAVLAAPDAPWPAQIGAAAGFARLGQRFDAERYPVWRYRLGELWIEEHLRPRLERTGLLLERTFEVLCTAEQPPALYLAAPAGRELLRFEREAGEHTGPPRWRARARTEVRF